MEYAKDSAFVKDFVSRTKANLDYDHPYEITQLINSLVGLLILPKEKYYENIQNNMVEPQLLHEIQQCITVPQKKKCNLQYIVRRMRNAISHFHIECKADLSTHEVNVIVFSDFDNGNDSSLPNFQIELPIDLVKQFVSQFSDSVAHSIETSKTELDEL